MSDPTTPLPTQGGSYVRSAAGTLERAEGPDLASEAEPEAPPPAAPTAKPARKEA